MGTIGKRHPLRVLERTIRDPNCSLCVLNESSANVCILGKGNPKSRVMLVGEAPGEAEGKTGKPFMGKAGQLLDHMLEQTGLDEHRPYITNVCKCRPPNNRPPEVVEMSACVHTYLVKELSYVRPNVIVCLGRIAQRVFNGELYNSYGGGKRGVVHTIALGDAGKTKVIFTYHPSYVNRMGGRDSKHGGPIYKDIKATLRLAKEIADAAPERSVDFTRKVHQENRYSGVNEVRVWGAAKGGRPSNYTKGRRARSAH